MLVSFPPSLGRLPQPSLLGRGRLFSQSLCDRIVNAVDGPGDSAARGARFGDYAARRTGSVVWRSLETRKYKASIIIILTEWSRGAKPRPWEPRLRTSESRLDCCNHHAKHVHCSVSVQAAHL